MMLTVLGGRDPKKSVCGVICKDHSVLKMKYTVMVILHAGT